MSFDKNYYAGRRAKLMSKQGQAMQRLNNAAFDYVNALSDLKEQEKELELMESESKKADKKDKK